MWNKGLVQLNKTVSNMVSESLYPMSYALNILFLPILRDHIEKQRIHLRNEWDLYFTIAMTWKRHK